MVISEHFDLADLGHLGECERIAIVVGAMDEIDDKLTPAHVKRMRRERQELFERNITRNPKDNAMILEAIEHGDVTDDHGAVLFGDYIDAIRHRHG